MSAWVTTIWNLPQPLMPWAVAAAGTLIAAVTDLQARRIPNWLTGPLFLAGIAWAGWQGGWVGATESLAAAVALALPFVLLFLFAGGGAGDAKLMGAVGAWLGLINGAAALVAVSMAGIVLAVSVALAKGRGREVAGNVGAIVTGWVGMAVARQAPVVVNDADPARTKAQTVPYGVAICAGVLIAGTGVLLWRS